MLPSRLNRSTLPGTWRRIFLALLALPFPLAAVTVSFNIEAESLQLPGGQGPAPIQSLVLLVADTGGDGFQPVRPGILTDVGSAIDGQNDVIIYRGDYSVTEQPGLLFETVTLNFDAPTFWQAGDGIGLYWFPALTLATPATTIDDQYGLYTDPAGIDGSDPWIAPPGGSVINLTFINGAAVILFDGLIDGSNPAAAGFADQVVVPEPAWTALAIGMLVLLLRPLRRLRL